MVFRTFAFLLFLSTAANATGSGLRSCTPEICKGVTCHILAKDELWKIVHVIATGVETIYVYKGAIGPDDKAIRAIPVKRPLMVCGSGYPFGMGRLLDASPR